MDPLASFFPFFEEVRTVEEECDGWWIGFVCEGVGEKSS